MLKPLLHFTINILLISFSFYACAQQQLYFNHLTVENGLSQSSVFSVAQDKHGFMWFGTKNGLNKFNGHFFETYKTGNTEKDYIVALQADKNGNLWIGSKRGLRKYIYSSDSFLDIDKNNNGKSILDGHIINCIYQGVDQSLWVGTNKGLNKLIKDDAITFKQLSGKINGLPSGNITAIYQDSLKNIWLGTELGLIKLIYQNNGYLVKNISLLKNKVSDDITSIMEDHQKNLWIGTKNDGIIRYNIINNKSDKLPQIISPVRKIIKDEHQNLWIATLKGLYFLNPQSKEIKLHINNPENPASISHNSIYDICIDRQKSIWLGTYYGGVNVAYSKTTSFKNYQHQATKNSLSSNVISTILENDESLWIGTEAEGLNHLNKITGKITHFKHDPNRPNSLSSDLVNAIYKDKKGQLWVGVVDGGLNLLSPDGKSFIHFKKTSEVKGSLNNNNVSSIMEDDLGRLWIGTMGGGLNIFDQKTQSFSPYTDFDKVNLLKNKWVKVIFKDTRNNLWVGTHSGVNLLKKGSDRFRSYTKDSSGLSSNLITCITESSNGNIWVGTNYGGLNLFDPDNNRFINYTMQHGLPSNNIMAIVEDNNKLLWISTDNGLSCFDVDHKIFRNYNKKDGLPGTLFNSNSFLKSKTGEIYFGSFNGLISFIPDHIQKNDSTYPIVFTGLKLFNETVKTNAEDKILRMNISTLDEINLKHNQNTFTLQFSSLNLIKSFKNKYAYKIEGEKGDWIQTSIPAITYTNLSPGTYDILVKSANSDGIWNQQPSKIRVNILPPFWKTGWAYLLYIALVGASCYFISKSLITKSKLKRDLYYEQLENTRQQKHQQMQLDFFTNISHELRTPLTLIIGPLNSAAQEVTGNSKLNQHLLLAKKHADLILKLVNELMDYRKSEAGELKLHLDWQPFHEFIQNTFEFFSNEASMRNINYQLEINNVNSEYFFDKNQLEKVVFNLLSNAFKFTPDNGNIKLKLDQDPYHLIMKVENDGKGIPENNLKDLFTKFYQIEAQGYQKNSSGVGLALAKAIVDLHQGSIVAESTKKSTDLKSITTFTVKLPLDPLATDKKRIAAYSENKKSLSLSLVSKNDDISNSLFTQNLNSRLSVLLVEDNNSMRSFIKSEIEHLYNVIEAENGQVALEIAKEMIPDLIISDAMMPIMDGLEFCKQVKNDESTAHIPVILLTARSEDANKFEGLETGANVYITKPFNTKWLLLNMNNLMVARESIRQRFSKKISLEPNEVEITSGDEKFIMKLINIIEKNIELPDFGVMTLSQEIGMSKNVLYRKIHALTGLSVGDFIKSIKLKKAAGLLKKRHLSIAEIAFYAGFNDTKYFGKEFKKYFSKSPSQYRTMLNEKELNS